MIDIRYFYPIKVKTVFRWSTTTYNQIIPVADGRKSNSRIVLYHTGYVTIGTGCFFYLLQTNYTKADRTFCYFLKRRSRNSYSFQLCSLLFHFNLNMRSTVIYTILGCKDRFVPQHGSLQTVDSRRNLFDAKMPFGICRRAYS